MSAFRSGDLHRSRIAIVGQHLTFVLVPFLSRRRGVGVLHLIKLLQQADGVVPEEAGATTQKSRHEGGIAPHPPGGNGHVAVLHAHQIFKKRMAFDGWDATCLR